MGVSTSSLSGGSLMVKYCDPGSIPGHRAKLISMYTINPTWEQAFRWAMLRQDYPFVVALGAVSLIAFFIVIYGVYSSAKWLPRVFENANIFGAFSFVTIAVAATCFLSTPINIKQNNDRLVSKEIKDNPTPYWDSLAAGHHIIDGPY